MFLRSVSLSDVAVGEMIVEYSLNIKLDDLAINGKNLNRSVKEEFSGPELLLNGFAFTEGPAVDGSGDLYYTEIPNKRIYRYHDDTLEIFLENSGGANGLYFDRAGCFNACAGKARQLIKINKEAQVEVLADNYNGKKLNSLNDLWIDPEGGHLFYGSQIREYRQPGTGRNACILSFNRWGIIQGNGRPGQT